MSSPHLFTDRENAGLLLTELLSELLADRALDDYTIVAVNADGVELSRPIAEAFGLSVVPLAVEEHFLCHPHYEYLTLTSLGNGRFHSGLSCEDGGNIGCTSALDLVRTLGLEYTLYIAPAMYAATMTLNLGRPVFAPQKALLVIDELGDGHGLIAAIEGLRRLGTQEIVVVTPICEPWMADLIDCECVSFVGICNWALLPETFTGFYASMPIDPLAVAKEVIRTHGFGQGLQPFMA